MKVFLAFVTIMFLIIPTHDLKAQTAHNSNIRNDISKSLYDIKHGLKKLGKVVSPTTQVYLPDELILYSMEDSVRLSATYTPNGSNDQILTQVWYSGHWVNYERSTWTSIDSTTESNLTLKQTWSNGQWQNTELDSSTYDAEGHMLVHLYKYWDQGAWKDSILSSRTYDANGNMLTNEGWYMINNQWTNFDLITYSYDSNGNRLSELFQFWVGGVWTNSDQTIYTYDENDNMLTRLKLSWNGQWQNAILSTYTYDANGNMLSFLFQNWANGQWTNYTINTYTYDANGKMLTDWYKGWTNGAWMNGSLHTYTYDANGNLINKLIQYWLNGLWTNFYQTIYTYDSNGNMITGNNTIWSVSSWVPADYDFGFAVSGSTYSFTGYRIIISWILVNTTDVPPDGSTIVKGYSLSQNYPNPFNPSTKISWQSPVGNWQSLKIYDVLGNLVTTLVDEYKPAGEYEVEFNGHSDEGQNLSSGVYFYQLSISGPEINSGQGIIQTKKMLMIK